MKALAISECICRLKLHILYKKKEGNSTMFRMTTGIPFSQEQVAEIIRERNPKPSTFLDAKNWGVPTVSDFLINEDALEDIDLSKII